MNKQELLEILQDWNFWNKELSTGRERRPYVQKCLKFLNINVITAITGIRRSGKSYIMRQVVKELIKGKIDGKNILIINFEDKRFTEFYPRILDEVYDTYVEFLKPNAKPIIFLDEVHNVPQWERWVRTMHELEKAKIVISGSSSKLLSGELASTLTGRHIDINVFPLDFSEFLKFKDIEIVNELDMIAKRADVKRHFNDYFEFGGFPEVVLSEEKKQLLLTYYDDILTKDIERRYKLKKIGKLRALTRFYLTNISNTITFNSLAKFLDTTANTIEKFSSYLEEANMIFFVRRFSYKIKEQEKTARKVYCIDSGLANAVGFKFSENSGRVAENIVAVELMRRISLDPNKEIYYWTNAKHDEVDFVIKEGLKAEQLIQVCWDINEYKTKERETKQLLKAAKELKCKNLLIITGDYDNEEIIKNYKIKYQSLWRWLLEINLKNR